MISKFHRWFLSFEPVVGLTRRLKLQLLHTFDFNILSPGWAFVLLRRGRVKCLVEVINEELLVQFWFRR